MKTNATDPNKNYFIEESVWLTFRMLLACMLLANAKFAKCLVATSVACNTASQNCSLFASLTES